MFGFGQKNKFVKSKDEIEKIKEAAKIVNTVHQILKQNIKAGISLIELDKIANQVILENKAKPAFLGYNGFPASICASVNEVLVHGIPNNYVLKDGDVISIDVGVEKNGYFGDAAFTVGVGKISSRAQELIDTANNSLDEVVKFLKPGIKVGDIGHLVETISKQKGFSVPLEYVGHGIGKQMHEDPMIPNYGTPNTGEKLEAGMVICVEPMLIDGEAKLFVDPIDHWTVRSVHKGLCAHVEHTILITENGAEVLNK